METWMLMAIASIFFGGFFSFGMKIISQRNYNTSFASIIAYSSAAFCAFWYYIFYYWGEWAFDGLLIILLLGFFNTFLYFLSTLARITSLNNVDTTIFFPLYKTFLPIIVTYISLFYFKENITDKEYLGIVLGIMVPLMLITKHESTVQRNLKVGLIFILVASFFAGISSIFPKEIQVKNLNVNLFVLCSFCFGTMISIVSYKFFDKKAKKKYSKKGIFKFGIILGILQFFGMYTFTSALEGNLAVVVTINSFSILIPIILSVIFYKEEMTKKKAFVIFLSIVSVILFI